jgi:hypothetical protein
MDAVGMGRHTLEDEAQKVRREVLPWRALAERGRRNCLHRISDIDLLSF